MTARNDRRRSRIGSRIRMYVEPADQATTELHEAIGEPEAKPGLLSPKPRHS